MAGRYFDEWQVGETIAHAVTRTVTETDNVLVSALTHNPQPMHLDHEVAAQSEFGKPLVNSIYTFGLMVGVSVSDTTLGTLVANLGYDKLVFPAPVFVGDTLRSESECLEVRESKSRPNAGIVTWEHRSFNQRNELVCKCSRSALLLKKPAMSDCGPGPRSWLFVPADSNKKMMKALDSEADAVIFDLEDSVVPAQKADGSRAAWPAARTQRWRA